MDTKELKKIFKSRDPIAIIKYFEWPIFSNDYAKAKYTILKIDKKRNRIQEIDVPFNLVPYVISKIGCFKTVLKLNEGIIWERMNFRQIAKHRLTTSKINEFINQY